MLLIKCKCGCHFTVKDDTIHSQSPYLICQNCRNKVQYAPDRFESSLTLSFFKEAEMTIQKIPDDADITITFKA